MPKNKNQKKKKKRKMRRTQEIKRGRLQTRDLLAPTTPAVKACRSPASDWPRMSCSPCPVISAIKTVRPHFASLYRSTSLDLR